MTQPEASNSGAAPVPPPAGIEAEPATGHLPRQLEWRASLLLVFTALLMAAALAYLLYARGVFESTQSLVLTTDDSEGVVVGMDMTFSGFPIGRVHRVELAPDGRVRILVDVALKDAHWLRSSSVFTLVRGVVGATNIRAHTGRLTDPPLPDGAERPVLRGDASAELPRVISAAREAVENLAALTAADGALAGSLGNLRRTTERLNGPQGALGVAFGNDADARKLVTAIERSNQILARVDALAQRLDGMTAHADAQVFGERGVVPEVRAAVGQLGALLAETRASLKQVDAVLVQVQAVGSNLREGTADLPALRAEVDASLRKVDGLVNEINRKWPFARDAAIKLP